MNLNVNELKSVGIIIPTYNGERFLEDTIKSCLNQTYNKVKIIIIDDKSSDSTYGRILKYNRYPNVKVVRNLTNLGFTQSCKMAASEIECDFLIFLGQDDLLHPEHVTKMLEFADDEASFIHCNSEVIDETSQFKKMARNDAIQKFKTRRFDFFITIDNFVSSTGLLINKRKYDQIGGYPTLYKNYGEWLLWIKLSRVGVVRYCNTSNAKYRHHSSSLIRNLSRKKKNDELVEYKINCNRFGLEIWSVPIKIVIVSIITINRVLLYMKKFVYRVRYYFEKSASY